MILVVIFVEKHRGIPNKPDKVNFGSNDGWFIPRFLVKQKTLGNFTLGSIEKYDISLWL